MSGTTQAEETARIIADMIAEFRLEFADKIRESFEEELRELEKSGYDAAEGTGRGPWWANGG